MSDEKVTPTDVMHFIENRGMEAVENYIQRGRPLKDRSEADLRDRGRAAWQIFAAEPSPGNRTEMNDCESEYVIRQLPLPNDPTVTAAMEELIRKVTALTEDILSDPARTQEVNKDLTDDIVKARDAANRSRKN